MKITTILGVDIIKQNALKGKYSKYNFRSTKNVIQNKERKKVGQKDIYAERF